MTDDTLEFAYREKLGLLLMTLVFFGACAAIGAYAALTNDAGVIINGLELGVTGATRFYWAMCVLSLGFVALAVHALVSGSTRARRIRLTHTYLQAPATRVARIATTIHLADVRAIDLQPVPQDLLLVIQHAGGTLTIPQSMLPDPARFQELCAALSARLRAAAANPAFAAAGEGRAG